MRSVNPLLHSLLIYVRLMVLLLLPLPSPSPSKYLSNAICDSSLHVRSQRPVCTKCTHAIWDTSKEPYSRVLLILKSIDLYVVSDIVCYFWMSYIGIFLSFSSLYVESCLLRVAQSHEKTFPKRDNIHTYTPAFILLFSRFFLFLPVCCLLERLPQHNNLTFHDRSREWFLSQTSS